MAAMLHLRRWRVYSFLLLAAGLTLFIVACGDDATPTPTQAPAATSTPTPTQAPAATSTPTPTRASPTAAPDEGLTTVIATVPVGDVPQGVGVNPTTNRVYVANFDDDTVSVIDGATNAVIATIPGGVSGPHDVGVNPTTDRVYVANLRGTVSTIDGATNAVIATVSVGGPSNYHVRVNPSTNRVYVTNAGDDTVHVIADTTAVPPP